MSPATTRLAPETVMAPLDTTSPFTLRVPEPLIDSAVPPAPPHPAWLRAARAGVNRRLLTPPDAVLLSVGFDPLVRILANCSWRELVAVRVNRLPCAPRAETTWVSTVPPVKVQVTVTGLAPGVP